MDATVRVLLAEDVASDAELELLELKRAGLKVDARVVDTEAAYRSALVDFSPQVILSDFSMPLFDGLSALSMARSLCPDVPFIFVSGTLGEEYAIRALKSGAVDYVLKSNLIRLPAAVERAIEQAAQHQRLARLGTIRDVLSAVNNAIVRIRDKAELIDEACRIAVEVGGLMLARLTLLDQQTGEPRLWAVRGEAAELFASPNKLEIEQGVMGETLRTGGVAIYNDLKSARQPPLGDTLLARGVRSGAGFPIVVDGTPAGAFVLHARVPGYFDQEEVRLLREVAGNIAFALSLLGKQEQLNYLAYYDPLTGLANRTFFHSSLAESVQNAARHSHVLAVLCMDIARFKAINDAFGQHGGDELLRQVGERLKSATGEDGRVARLSADRFAILLPAVKDVPFIARVVLERMRGLLDGPFDIDGRELRISARTGIAVFPNDGGDADTLFRNAEAALQKARATGERFAFYAPEINLRFAERLDLENRLRRAVERNALSLFYQPKVDLRSGEVVALEALMRWHDGDHGIVLPGRFISILEDTGLIIEAGRAAIELAVATHAGWRQRGLNPPRIAVNVSAIQLRHASFVDELRRVLAPILLSERGLDLEITETVLMENVTSAIEKLKEIRELGVEIAIDDFGTGYSSLAYINKLPIHLLKIDRSFVSGVTTEAESHGIVSAIVALARGLKLKVVAEGVETTEQAEAVKRLGCDQIQGYLVGRPMAREDIEARLADHSAAR
jgi:diguanylate cyclase (GGDEF)-like protein